MSVRSTVILVVIACLLGLLWWFQDKVKAPDDDSDHPSLASFTGDEVVGVDMTLHDKPMNVEKKGDLWIVSEPYKGLASSRDFQNFVNQLASAKAERVVNKDMTKSVFKEYGLDKPAIVVKVHLKDKKETPTFSFGSQSPGDTGYYVRLDDENRVLLTNSSFNAALARTPDAWRESSPLPIDVTKVDRVAETGNGVDVEVNKVKDKDEWTMEKPQKGKADPQSVSSWLVKISNVRATKFVDKMSPSDPKLKPMLTLKVWNKGERDPMTLILGDEVGGGRYAVRTVGSDSEVFIVPLGAIVPLTADASALAVKTLFDFDVARAARAQISMAGVGDAEAEKKNDEWTYTKPSARKDDMGHVSALLYSLTALKYDRKVADPAELAKAEATFSTPMARFEISDDKGAQLALLVIGGPAPQSRRYVKTSGKDIYVADVSFANDWKSYLAALKAPETSPSGAAQAAPSGVPASPPAAIVPEETGLPSAASPAPEAGSPAPKAASPAAAQPASPAHAVSASPHPAASGAAGTH